MLERLYASAGDAQLKGQAGGMFDAVKRIESIRQQPYTPANGVFYNGEFGRRLQQLARLIKSDVGVEVAFVDLDGWDHHANEVGQLGNLLNQFGQRALRVRARSRRPHGRRGRGDDVGVRPDGGGERQPAAPTTDTAA